MSSDATLSIETLRLDCQAETERIVASVKRAVRDRCGRRGVVLGISGGIDSSVCAALCARAVGPQRVLGLFMPERDSSPDSLELGQELAAVLGFETRLEDITPILEGTRCYEKRDDAVRSVVPDYDIDRGEFKLVRPGVLDGGSVRLFSVVARVKDGSDVRKRLPPEAYRTLVAATNFKQRVRKMLEYYHADERHYAVCGTPNRQEYDQGFFVKQGDGAADFKPIAHLYKTQVYQLAEHLGVPASICSRPPTTDTFSMPQTQDEFYFSVPHPTLDLVLYAHDNGLAAEAAAAATDLSPDQVEKVVADIEAKRRATRYLHLPPLLVESVPGVDVGLGTA